MRIATIGLVVFWMAVGAAWGEEAGTAADVQAGHRLVSAVCGNCHVATPDQPMAPILYPPAPPLASIVQRKDFTADWLQNFLTTTHRGLDMPNGMPSPYLADFQVQQVIAYLMSLRK